MPQRNAQKQLTQAVNTRVIALNPTLELVAVATSEHQVDVFRFGGQRAFGTRSSRDRASVLAICWHYDGSELAIWWDDNTWQRLDSWTGQAGPVLGFFARDSDPVSAIDHVTWQQKDIDPASSSSTAFFWGSNGPQRPSKQSHSLNGPVGSPVTEEALSARTIGSDSDFDVQHLPKLLASFDISDELPRLSALPQVFDAQLDTHTKQLLSFFSRQELLDTMKDSFRPTVSNSMDLLLVSYDYGHLNLGQGFAYRSANMEICETADSMAKHRIVAHDSHPFARCEAFITSATGQNTSSQSQIAELTLRYLSLAPLETSGIYVPLVFQAINQLSLLDSYITLCITAVRDAWSHARDVFSRFIRSIESTLSETANTATPEVSIVTALVRSVTTGNCGPEIVEWIVEIMGTKGIDRWHTAYTRGLAQVIDLIHSNLLPALDRTSIEVSRLRAMCRSPHTPICQLSAKGLDRILADTETLRTLSNTALVYARQEIPQIEAFTSFMRCQFQMLKEPNSTGAKEAVDTFASLDHAQLLSFITGPMTKSHLNVFFGRDTAMVRGAPRRPRQFAPKKIILSMLERHSINPLQPTTPVVEFVNLLYQSFFLSDSIQEIQNQTIALFEKDTIQLHPIPLDADIVLHAGDIRMCRSEETDKSITQSKPENRKELMMTVIVGASRTSKDKVLVYVWVHDRLGQPNSSLGSEQPLAKGSLTLTGHTILDVKFVSNNTLVFLVQRDQDGARLMMMYPSSGLFSPSGTPTGDVVPSASEVKRLVIHTFDRESGAPSSSSTDTFKPATLQVPRTPGGASAAPKVLLVDEARKGYEVYDVSDVT